MTMSIMETSSAEGRGELNVLRRFEEYGSETLYRDAYLERVLVDENNGILTLFAVSGEKKRAMIVYEDMYCSQLGEDAEGLLLLSAEEITPDKLLRPERRECAAALKAECGVDNDFLTYMHRRGNKLFLHHAETGDYVVLAKKMWISHKIEERENEKEKCGTIDVRGNHSDDYPVGMRGCFQL